jgi:hypothetical protein
VVAIIIAFGHSLLSMSGFETLAQVYREIAYPKARKLKLTANTVCIYAVLGTGVVTVFAGYIIPSAVRANYSDNVLGEAYAFGAAWLRSCCGPRLQPDGPSEEHPHEDQPAPA